MVIKNFGGRVVAHLNESYGGRFAEGVLKKLSDSGFSYKGYCIGELDEGQTDIRIVIESKEGGLEQLSEQLKAVIEQVPIERKDKKYITSRKVEHVSEKPYMSVMSDEHVVLTLTRTPDNNQDKLLYAAYRTAVKPILRAIEEIRASKQ